MIVKCHRLLRTKGATTGAKRASCSFFLMIVACVLLKYAPAIINSIVELVKVLQ